MRNKKAIYLDEPSEKAVNEIIETNPLNSINNGSKIDYWTDVLSHICVYGD
jgi:hypothetical protein